VDESKQAWLVSITDAKRHGLNICRSDRQIAQLIRDSPLRETQDHLLAI
jgi:hypothetical protein